MGTLVTCVLYIHICREHSHTSKTRKISLKNGVQQGIAITPAFRRQRGDSRGLAVQVALLNHGAPGSERDPASKSPWTVAKKDACYQPLPSTDTCACAQTHAHIHTRTHTQRHLHAFLMYAETYITHTHICAHAHILICPPIYTETYIHHTHSATHTHTVPRTHTHTHLYPPSIQILTYMHHTQIHDKLAFFLIFCLFPFLLSAPFLSC